MDCPKCKKDEISYGYCIKKENGQKIQKIHCKTCNHSWFVKIKRFNPRNII